MDVKEKINIYSFEKGVMIARLLTLTRDFARIGVLHFDIEKEVRENFQYKPEHEPRLILHLTSFLCGGTDDCFSRLIKGE